ncbi:MAG: radical SAM protein [Endomicrobiaceae bacterium]
MRENKDKDFYLQGTDAEKEHFSGSRGVSFEWNIIYQCNYRCSYCIFDGKWDEYGPRTVFKSVNELLEIWDRIYSLYGKTSIVFTGGEPTVYPDFFEFVSKLSEKHYPINISSNGSGDLKRLCEICDNTKVSVSISFHPEFDKAETVIERAKYLKAKGFLAEFINYCCYPPHIPKLMDYVKMFKDNGLTIKAIPFCGQYEGKSYPDSYTAQEKEILGINDVWETNVKRKGTLCAAGQKSALIFPDGKVARCGQIGERVLVGNIFDKDFKLLDKPQECDVDICPCLKAVEA